MRQQVGKHLWDSRLLVLSRRCFYCVTVKINHLLCRWREYLQIKAAPVLK